MPLVKPTTNGAILLLAIAVSKSGTTTPMQFYFMANNGTSIGINTQKLAIRVFYF